METTSKLLSILLYARTFGRSPTANQEVVFLPYELGNYPRTAPSLPFPTTFSVVNVNSLKTTPFFLPQTLYTGALQLQVV